MEPNSASLFFLKLIIFSFQFQSMAIFIPYLWHILPLKYGILYTLCLIIQHVNGRHTFIQSLLYSISPLVLQDVYALVEPALNDRCVYGLWWNDDRKIKILRQNAPSMPHVHYNSYMDFWTIRNWHLNHLKYDIAHNCLCAYVNNPGPLVTIYCTFVTVHLHSPAGQELNFFSIQPLILQS